MKQIVLGIITLIIVALVYATYLYYKPHKNIETAKEDVAVTAPNLYAEYTNNEYMANEKYLDKLILVTGIIDEKSIDESKNVNLYLNVASDAFGKVSCNFNRSDGAKALNYKQGMQVKVKGICTGYMMDVVLNKCVIVE